MQTEEYAERVEEMPFNYLMCDLPPPPLFPDGMQENIIPQVPIFQILNKFNGIQEKEYKTYKDSTMKKFELTRLPPYIILYFKVGKILKNFIVNNGMLSEKNLPRISQFLQLLYHFCAAVHEEYVYNGKESNNC